MTLRIIWLTTGVVLSWPQLTQAEVNRQISFLSELQEKHGGVPIKIEVL